MQNTYGLFPIIMSNDPCKNKFNHASAKSVPTFGSACVLYGELREKWTCVIFADFGHGDFLSQNELPKFFFLPRFAYQECQNFQLNLCAEFCACKKYSMRLSDGRFCPRIGALMIHCIDIGLFRQSGCPKRNSFHQFYGALRLNYIPDTDNVIVNKIMKC